MDHTFYMDYHFDSSDSDYMDDRIMTMPNHEQKLLEDLTQYVGALTNSLMMKTLTIFVGSYRQEDIVILRSNAVQSNSSCIAL